MLLCALCEFLLCALCVPKKFQDKLNTKKFWFRYSLRPLRFLAAFALQTKMNTKSIAKNAMMFFLLAAHYTEQRILKRRILLCALCVTKIIQEVVEHKGHKEPQWTVSCDLYICLLSILCILLCELCEFLLCALCVPKKNNMRSRAQKIF